MVVEVVQTVTGLLDVHRHTHVVFHLVPGVETLQCLLTNLTGLVTGTVTAQVLLLIPVSLEHHSWV